MSIDILRLGRALGTIRVNARETRDLVRSKADFLLVVTGKNCPKCDALKPLISAFCRDNKAFVCDLPYFDGYERLVDPAYSPSFPPVYSFPTILGFHDGKPTLNLRMGQESAEDFLQKATSSVRLSSFWIQNPPHAVLAGDNLTFRRQELTPPEMFDFHALVVRPPFFPVLFAQNEDPDALSFLSLWSHLAFEESLGIFVLPSNPLTQSDFLTHLSADLFFAKTPSSPFVWLCHQKPDAWSGLKGFASKPKTEKEAILKAILGN